MKVRLADTRRSRCNSENIPLLASITGLSTRTIERRLKSVHGNTRLGRVFAKEWPLASSALGRLSVGAVRGAVLDVDVADATGLGLREVRRRLVPAGDRVLLKRIFSKLALERPKTQRRTEKATNDDMEYVGWHRYARPSAKFSVSQLLGEARTTSIRNAPLFLEWFAGVVRLERRAVQQMLRAWHGHGNVRRVFSKHWPAEIEAVPRQVLGAFRAEATRRSPALVRLVADVCNLQPQRTLDRLMGARRNERTDDVVPELRGAG